MAIILTGKEIITVSSCVGVLVYAILQIYLNEKSENIWGTARSLLY